VTPALVATSATADAIRPGAGLPRLLAGRPGGGHDQGLAEHLRQHGLLPAPASAAVLIDEIGAAGLTGRGGAAFPTARKLAAVRAAGQVDAVIAGNGAEGEPASRKDVTLLWHAPHLVLDGLQLAAGACDATAAVLYVHGGDPDLLGHLESAIGARQAAGADRLAVRLIEAPPRFLSGEESALVAHVSGGPAVPAFKQPRVFERGIGGRPTLVQNVETLAHMALIARHGAGWFRGVGTPDEPGSMLCTVQEADGRTWVAEATLGTLIGQLVRIDAGVQAVLTGGYHGGWLTAAEARQLPLANASLRPAGTFVGAGVLAALPATACGLAETANVARYLALESAGQCGPCLNGLPRIAAALGVLARPRPARAELASVRRWAGLVTGRGACHHPDGTVRFVASALRVFAAEIAEHDRGRCTGTTAASFLPVPAAPAAESDWR
jgi:NADH:ubiquinone oxidoreductase subunit F (NADH-binding)